jgi:hypothetical protein
VQEIFGRGTVGDHGQSLEVEVAGPDQGDGSGSVAPRIVEVFRTVRPLVDFINVSA